MKHWIKFVPCYIFPRTKEQFLIRMKKKSFTNLRGEAASNLQGSRKTTEIYLLHVNDKIIPKPTVSVNLFGCGAVSAGINC